MKHRLRDAGLDRFLTDLDYVGRFDKAIARAFRKVMNLIERAVDERDLRAFRSLNFEKLKGDRSHQWSLRLNDQWRLIVEIEAAEPKNVIVVIGIEDYH